MSHLIFHNHLSPLITVFTWAFQSHLPSSSQCKTWGEGVQISYCNYGETGRWHGQERLLQMVKSEMSEEVKQLSEGEVGETSHEKARGLMVGAWAICLLCWHCLAHCGLSSLLLLVYNLIQVNCVLKTFGEKNSGKLAKAKLEFGIYAQATINIEFAFIRNYK